MKALVTLTKSPINYKFDQGRTLRALGLRKMGDKGEFEYTQSIRGMFEKVKHLITIEFQEETPAKGRKRNA